MRFKTFAGVLVPAFILWGSLVAAQVPVNPPAKPIVAAAMKPDRTHSRGYLKPPNLAALKAAKFKEHGAKLRALAAKALPDQYMSPYQVAQQDQGNCHPRGTMIRMADGSERPIESIRKGDWIMGGDGQPVKVFWASSRVVAEALWSITTESGKELPVTGEHWILTRRGYVPAKWIRAGDEVSRGPERFEVVASISRNALFGGPVYSLDVSRSQNYFANGIVCHNCGDCWCVSASVCASMAFVASGTFQPYSPTLTDGSNVISANSVLFCTSTGGCNGDDASTVFTYGQNTGLSTIACYGPYQDTDRGSCNSSCPKFKLSSWGYADGTGDGSSSFDEICTAIYQYGSVILTNDADALGDGTQVVTETGHGTDHQIAGVGFDRVKKIVWGKNQWGQWGQSIAGQPGPGFVPIGVLSDGETMAASCSSEVLWCEAGAGPVPPTPPTPVPPTPVPPGPTPTPATFNELMLINPLPMGTYSIVDTTQSVIVSNADAQAFASHLTALQTIMTTYTPAPAPTPPPPPAPVPTPAPMTTASQVWIFVHDKTSDPAPVTALLGQKAYLDKLLPGAWWAVDFNDKSGPGYIKEAEGATLCVLVLDATKPNPDGSLPLLAKETIPADTASAAALKARYQSPAGR